MKRKEEMQFKLHRQVEMYNRMLPDNLVAAAGATVDISYQIYMKQKINHQKRRHIKHDTIF
jgi:hypothetical protein